MPEDTNAPTPGHDERPESGPVDQPEPTVDLHEDAETPADKTPAADADATQADAIQADAAEPPSTEPAVAADAPAGASAVPAADAPKKGKRRILAVVAAVVVLLLVAGGAVGATLYLKNRPHKISTPATAGGMKRDKATEKKYATQLAAIKQQIQKQVGGTKKTKIAVYNQTKSSRGAVGPVVFFGAELTDKQASSESPTKWIDGKLIKTFEKNKLKVLKFNLDGGGRAVCAEQSSAKTAACVWRTQDSVGELFPINPGWTAQKMSKLMKAVRADVEKV